MSDPMTMAKSAREALARALAALQADPTVPPELLAIAEPVSQGMGPLFQIERSQGAALPEQLPLAVDAVRRSLAMLQAQPSEHAAAVESMEAVAAALGLVHGLTRLAPKEQALPQPAPVVMHSPPAEPVPVQAAQIPQPAPEPQPPAPLVQADAQPAPTTQAAPQLANVQPAPAKQPALAIPHDAARAEVSLGTHSISNLYQGLVGNDIVENGGIFVATYNVLPLGQRVALRILFPGGNQIDALGVVHWIREARGRMGETSETVHPGYGARFVEISKEGRDLVHRYAQNREPIFYDDV